MTTSTYSLFTSDIVLYLNPAAQTRMRGMKSLLLCVMLTLCGVSSFDTMINYPRMSQECLAKQVMAELRADMQEFVVELHFRMKYAAENSPDTVHRFCQLYHRMDQLKPNGANTCKTGLLPQ